MAPRKLIFAAAPLALLAVTAATCSGNGEVALPTSKPPNAPPPSSAATLGNTTAAPDAKSAITKVYTGYWPASADAATAGPGRARELLAPYVTGRFLDVQVQRIGDYQAHNQEPWGQPVVHITKITLLPGHTASLHDCLDASRAGLADRRTHQLLSGTLGSVHTHMAADLKRGSDGRWRLTSLVQLEAPCTAGSSS
jgi:hypothetical protein